jgi:hypothetical protein
MSQHALIGRRPVLCASHSGSRRSAAERPSITTIERADSHRKSRNREPRTSKFPGPHNRFASPHDLRTTRSHGTPTAAKPFNTPRNPLPATASAQPAPLNGHRNQDMRRLPTLWTSASTRSIRSARRRRARKDPFIGGCNPSREGRDRVSNDSEQAARHSGRYNGDFDRHEHHSDHATPNPERIWGCFLCINAQPMRI